MIGQIVQDVKDNVSHAFWTECRQIPRMAKKATPSESDLAIVKRTKTAREARFGAAKDMAKALDVGNERYAKWETRSPIPHEFIEQFCLIAGVSIEWLITGEEVRRRA